MCKKVPELSKGEWVIMKICWQHQQCTARNVYEHALPKKKWEYQTVKTMLDRLVTKGYLSREKFGPIYIYKPIIPRSQAITKAIDDFISTTLDNTFTPILAYFAKEKNLSDEELASLKKLIEQQEGVDE